MHTGRTMGDRDSHPRPLKGIPQAALEAFRFPGQAHLSPMRFREFFIVGVSVT